MGEKQRIVMAMERQKERIGEELRAKIEEIKGHRLQIQRKIAVNVDRGEQYAYGSAGGVSTERKA